MIELMEHQQDAIERLSNGNILYGGVGRGKSATVLGYYMKREAPRDIVVITTAKKRDSLDWEKEALEFGISTEPELSMAGSLTVDSWNNIKKYQNVYGKFFVFDEQRLVGTGTWTKSFLKIANKNHWILLSATPGDTWMDYASVFVANRFFKSITDFKRQHVVYKPFVRYPDIDRYIGEAKLERLRNQILVEMPYEAHTERVLKWYDVEYDKAKFDKVWKDRWNIFDDQPIVDIAELFRLMRKVVNMDPSRLVAIHDLLKKHDKLVIFYNFNYELGLLRSALYGIEGLEVGEWNGHLKTPIPIGDKWVYLVQYTAGAEAWECTETNAMVFYSLTYSFKNFEQAQGRIDRLNTPFKTLYYYVFVTNSVIDRAIRRALALKRDFNERKFMRNPEHEIA